MDTEKAFAAVESRAATLRLTVPEMLAETVDVTPLSYWRAKSGKYARTDTSVKVLRACEGTLDRIESEKSA